jgi:CheY-like chemotaxis protein
VQVHYQCDALVDGNEAQLGQLFLNLLVNAAQAIAERQHGATAPELDRVSVVLQATDGGIEIAVSDTGTGIDPALVERIFEPFFSTRAPGQGTGLGLAVCASVVAAHGGTIQAASRPGQGCRFTLQLPAAAAGDTPARPATGREVLVVCGEPRTFRTLQETLRGHRMTYIGAESLALRLLRQQRYDVLVCDTVLSEAERARFLADVRSLQPELGGRTIVITPRGVPERNRPLQDPGNEGFRLERPVTAAALAQAMHQVLAPVLDRAPDGSVDRPRA